MFCEFDTIRVLRILFSGSLLPWVGQHFSGDSFGSGPPESDLPDQKTAAVHAADECPHGEFHSGDQDGVFGQDYFYIRTATPAGGQGVSRILEPLSSPCRAWRENGQTVSSGYECHGQRGFISWWSASRLSTRTSGGVSVRNLCTPVTRA